MKTTAGNISSDSPFPRITCYQFLQTADKEKLRKNKCVCVTDYIPYWHVYKTCHITSMAGSVREGGAVRGDKAAKPVTAVRVWVSTFESVKPLNIFKETSERFLATFEETNKTDICFRNIYIEFYIYIYIYIYIYTICIHADKTVCI